MTHDVGNPGPGLRQKQKRGGVKSAKRIPCPLLENGSPMAKDENILVISNTT